MAFLKRSLRILFARAEAIFDWSFGQRNNPIANLGSLGWYFFWIVAASGIYLYLFFDTGITDAYASVEYITNDQWYAAGVMRSLHRYASDALVIVVFLHILREFSLDRMRGKRFFAWLTGVPLIWFIYICGITGYWLVWDKLAQYIAIATSEWLDTLPFFGEPIANNFLNSTTLGGRFFTLMVFMHIFAPLFMLFLMWLHIQRHARARVNPPRSLAIGTAITLTVLSLVYPAVSQGPANLDAVPATVNLDWYYLAAYPLLDVIPGGQLWLILVVGSIVLSLMRLWSLFRRLPVQRNYDGASQRWRSVRGRGAGQCRQLRELRHLRGVMPDRNTLSARHRGRSWHRIAGPPYLWSAGADAESIHKLQ
jgi:quinol-cytochrome oxidoreductase complex cytochrome b subunit